MRKTAARRKGRVKRAARAGAVAYLPLAGDADRPDFWKTFGRRLEDVRKTPRRAFCTGGPGHQLHSQETGFCVRSARGGGQEQLGKPQPKTATRQDQTGFMLFRAVTCRAGSIFGMTAHRAKPIAMHEN